MKTGNFRCKDGVMDVVKRVVIACWTRYCFGKLAPFRDQMKETELLQSDFETGLAIFSN